MCLVRPINVLKPSAKNHSKTDRNVYSGLNERDIQILAGTTHNDRNGVKKLVKRIIRHEKYNHTDQNYDIALLELSSPLKYSESIRPIALPSANQSFPDHLMCLVSGWGDTQSFILNLFGRTDLRAVEVPIVNQNKCEKYYENVGLEITPQMACAGFDRGGADSCQGDSGGPLACPTPSTKRSSPPVLFGIVSWGAKCAEPYLPGVYTRVPTVREWIFAKTGV